jgi:fluoride ion exporter CrcB/FEX
MLLSSIYVFFGGAFDALSRFLISEFFSITKLGIPFTLIFINFFGCLLMGVFNNLLEMSWQNHNIRLL